MGLLVVNEQREAYDLAEHLAMLAAGESTTIPDDVRALYARGEAGEISSDAIVSAIVARYGGNREENYWVLDSMQDGTSARDYLPVISGYEYYDDVNPLGDSSANAISRAAVVFDLVTVQKSIHRLAHATLILSVGSTVFGKNQIDHSTSCATKIATATASMSENATVQTWRWT